MIDGTIEHYYMSITRIPKMKGLSYTSLELHPRSQFGITYIILAYI